MKKFRTVFMAALLLAVSLPAPLRAESGYMNAREICLNAESDAQVDYYSNMGGRYLWGGIGCVLSVVGVILGYTVSPGVPPDRLMGKSSAYAEEYSRCYSEKQKGFRGLDTIYGCSVGILLLLTGGYFILVSSYSYY